MLPHRALPAALALVLSACHLVFPHAGGARDARPGGGEDHGRDLSPDTGPATIAPVDLLFVIDNSGSMEQEQKKLSNQFPALIEALKLDGKLPDLRIGIVSTDLGAGDGSLPTCTAEGDYGKLQAGAKVPGCAVPTDPWISHANGVTNVPGGTSGATDPSARVKEAFACIAELGIGGCGFESPLEAARRALDPQQNVNPGFLRPDARLAVVFLTDEDDCSAQDEGLFDSANPHPVLGPLTSYRCTRFGTTCKEGLATAGPKTGCQPSGTYLHPVESYLKFFGGLKPPGKLFLAAIAGPETPFVVGQPAGQLELEPSCQAGAAGAAVPALRIRTVLEGVAANGQTGLFNRGVTAQDGIVDLDICSADYAPAMRLLGLKLAGAI